MPLKLQLYMDELKKGKYEAAEFTSLDLNSSDVEASDNFSKFS